MNNEKYNVLITGAGGFLGLQVAKILKEEGHQVTNFSRSHHKKLLELGIQTIKGNLDCKEDITKAFQEKEFDSVIHIAAKIGMWGKYKDFYQTNVAGTENILSIAKDHGVKRFIFTSSPSVIFGNDHLEGVNEDHPYPEKYLNAYAETKSLAEQMVLKANSKTFFTTALRPHLIYGENDPNFIPRLIEARKKNKLKQVGDGKNLVDVIYVRNAAKAHLQLLEQLDQNKETHGKAYFLGQERPVKLWPFINDLLELHGQPKIEKKISFKLAYKIGHFFEIILTLFRQFKKNPPMTRFMACQLAKNHYFSHENAKKDFNYSPKYSIKDSFCQMKKSQKQKKR